MSCTIRKLSEMTEVGHADRGRKQALAELDELPMLGIPPIDTSFFEVLWPFAQEARAIIDLHWPSIEQISRHLVKVGSMRGDEIEALVARNDI